MVDVTALTQTGLGCVPRDKADHENGSLVVECTGTSERVIRKSPQCRMTMD